MLKTVDFRWRRPKIIPLPIYGYDSHLPSQICSPAGARVEQVAEGAQKNWGHAPQVAKKCENNDCWGQNWLPNNAVVNNVGRRQVLLETPRTASSLYFWSLQEQEDSKQEQKMKRKKTKWEGAVEFLQFQVLLFVFPSCNKIKLNFVNWNGELWLGFIACWAQHIIVLLQGWSWSSFKRSRLYCLYVKRTTLIAGNRTTGNWKPFARGWKRILNSMCSSFCGVPSGNLGGSTREMTKKDW